MVTWYAKALTVMMVDSSGKQHEGGDFGRSDPSWM